MISCLQNLISNAVRKYPKNIAIIETSNTPRIFKYSELNNRTLSYTSQLLYKGLKKGDRVAILARNCFEYVAMYLAIAQAGGVSVPLKCKLNTDDLIKQCNNCGITAIYADKQSREKERQIKAKVRSIKFNIESTLLG